MAEHILLRNRDIPDIDQLAVYLEHGGFEAFKQVVREINATASDRHRQGLRACAGAAAPGSRRG